MTATARQRIPRIDPHRCIDCDARYLAPCDADGCPACGSTDVRPLDASTATTVPAGERAADMYQWERATGRTGPIGERPKSTAAVLGTRGVDVPLANRRQRIARIA